MCCEYIHKSPLSLWKSFCSHRLQNSCIQIKLDKYKDFGKAYTNNKKNFIWQSDKFYMNDYK